MQDVEINAELTAKNGNDAKGVTAKVQLGENLDELGSQFGPEIVYSHARRSIVIAMQTSMRGMLDSGKSPEEIQTAMVDWKPGVKRAAKSTYDRVKEDIARMSPEDKKRIIRELREKAQA
jgi:hypothetical protein